MKLSRYYSVIILLILWHSVISQTAESKTIKVHFLYGSKPAKGFKNTEYKWFGGIHGGHVYLQETDSLFSFYPASNWHIFAYEKDLGGVFMMDDLEYWQKDTLSEKYATIIIPVTNEQLELYDSIRRKYLSKAPYDYAFFGMRCASATYDILSQIGILKRHSRFWNIYKFFYPKTLRKRIFKLADRNNWTVKKKQGSPSRKWERD